MNLRQTALRFYISLDGGDMLPVSSIWPDGDGPENPTEEDVARLIGENHYSPSDWLREWNMDRSLRVYVGKTEVKFR